MDRKVWKLLKLYIQCFTFDPERKKHQWKTRILKWKICHLYLGRKSTAINKYSISEYKQNIKAIIF